MNYGFLHSCNFQFPKQIPCLPKGSLKTQPYILPRTMVSESADGSFCGAVSPRGLLLGPAPGHIPTSRASHAARLTPSPPPTGTQGGSWVGPNVLRGRTLPRGNKSTIVKTNNKMEKVPAFSKHKFQPTVPYVEVGPSHSGKHANPSDVGRPPMSSQGGVQLGPRGAGPRRGPRLRRASSSCRELAAFAVIARPLRCQR